MCEKCERDLAAGRLLERQAFEALRRIRTFGRIPEADEGDFPSLLMMAAAEATVETLRKGVRCESDPGLHDLRRHLHNGMMLGFMRALQEAGLGAAIQDTWVGFRGAEGTKPADPTSN